MQFKLFIFGLFVVSSSALSIHQNKREECTIDQLNHFITPEPVLGQKAMSACEALGGVLAEITAENLPVLAKAVESCLGPNSRTRIRSWNTNSFDSTELSMMSSESSGTVNVGAAGEELHALCQRASAESSEEESSSSEKGSDEKESDEHESPEKEQEVSSEPSAAEEESDDLDEDEELNDLLERDAIDNEYFDDTQA